jgi:hypothetical protein
VRVRKLEFTSESPYRLPIYLVDMAPIPGERVEKVAAIDVHVLGQDSWGDVAAALATAMPDSTLGPKTNPEAWQEIAQRLEAQPGRAVAYLAPRGIGPTQWNALERADTQIRRRFMLLGQTADGMRIWDVRRGLLSLQSVAGLEHADRTLHGTADAAAIALYAALYENQIHALQLTDPPARNRDGLTLLNVSKFLEMPQLVLMVARRGVEIAIRCAPDQQPFWQPVVDSPALPPRSGDQAQVTLSVNER